MELFFDLVVVVAIAWTSYTIYANVAGELARNLVMLLGCSASR